MKRLWFSVFTLLLCSSCCLGPKVTVVKNPSDCEEGIRYYRPKPYLFISPVDKTVTTTKDGSVTVPGASPDAVQIKLQYLPDYTEEYSLQVDPGLGIATVNIKLQDGWNLTEINQTLDSNFDDNVKAVAELAKSAASFKTSAGDSTLESPVATVSATNVPIGYYESVIGRDQCGRKQMYGWRYLGFMPYNTCPLDAHGMECHPCGDPNAIYGLVFVDGRMAFRQIGVIQGTGDPVVVKADKTEEGRQSIESEASFASLKAGATGEVAVSVKEDYVDVSPTLKDDQTKSFVTNLATDDVKSALRSMKKKLKITPQKPADQ